MQEIYDTYVLEYGRAYPEEVGLYNVCCRDTLLMMLRDNILVAALVQKSRRVGNTCKQNRMAQ